MDGLAAPGAASPDGQGGADAVEERHRAAIEARIEQLGELSRQKDSASVEAILLDIRSPDKEIREAALDALMQSGNRDTIPRLADLAQQTDDPEQKRAIEEAAEFLKLPTITEVLGVGKAGGVTPGPKAGTPGQK